MSGGIAGFCLGCGRMTWETTVITMTATATLCNCNGSVVTTIYANTPDPDLLPRSRRERRIMASARRTGPNWRPRPGVS